LTSERHWTKVMDKTTATDWTMVTNWINVVDTEHQDEHLTRKTDWTCDGLNWTIMTVCTRVLHC